MELMNRALKWGWLLYLRVRVATTLWWLRKKASLTRVESAQKLGVDEMVLGSYECARVSPPMHMIAEMLRRYRADERAILFFCMTPYRGQFWRSTRLTKVGCKSPKIVLRRKRPLAVIER